MADLRPGLQGPVQEEGVETGTADEVERVDQPVPDQRTAVVMQCEAAGDRVHDAVTNQAIRRAPVQPFQQPHAFPRQQAPAEFGAREGSLVQKQDGDAAPRQGQSGGTSRGARSGDDHVGMLHVGVSPP